MISIVIPAHNESSVIARALTAMLRNAREGELDIVVVCNACSDDTATIARNFGPSVRVIETNIQGKPNALNLGDKAAKAFPRVYADADVVIDFDSISALVRRLEKGDVCVVAPHPKMDLQNCSRLVRAYFDIRENLPSARQGVGGSGVYALSETGRARFADFPQLTSDDGYVRLQFSENERATVKHAESIVFAPQSLRDLLAIRTRSYYGSIELSRRFPELWKNKGESNHMTLYRLFRFPRIWPNLLVYCCINIIARGNAVARLMAKRRVWDRDNSSRECAPATPISFEER